MKILCFSDWQGKLKGDFLVEVLKKCDVPDFLIFAGDGILNLISERDYPVMDKSLEGYINGHYRKYGKSEGILSKLVNIPKKAFLYVEGNDDPMINLNSKGAIRISGKSFRCFYNFVGLEGSTDPIGGITRREEGYYWEVLENALKVGERMIIVSHAPPYGILDKIPRGTKIGSKSLRGFLEIYSHWVPLVLCGHAHNYGGRWIRFKETVVINCAMSVVEVEVKEGFVGRIRIVF
ncbi:MAG: metallophosphoesterase [candidate division WOR-3 bacterium]